MESGPLSTDEFTAFSEEVIPFLHVTTQIEGRENDGMLRDYGGRGFPTLLYLDADGKKLAEPAGRSVDAFRTTATALTARAKLQKRIAAGEKGLEAELLVAELELGSVSFTEAKERLAKIEKIDEKLSKRLDQLLIDAEVRHLYEGASRDREKRAAADQRFAEMAKEGKVPTGMFESFFWSRVEMAAREAKDVELYEKTVAALNKLHSDNPRAKRYLETLAKRLEEMKQ